MKVLHLSSSFFPTSTGGKEVFVYQLIKNTQGLDHTVLYHQGMRNYEYEYEGIPVHVLPLPIPRNNRKAYYDLLYENLSGFEDFLDGLNPDVVHFHDQSESASLSHLMACRKRGIKTLLTYHSPGQSCLQRSLSYAGKENCNGLHDLMRCSSCRYQVRGLPKFISDITARIPFPFDTDGKFVQQHSTQLYLDSWKKFYASVDAVQVHAHWVEDMLISNGVGFSKIHFIPMGGHDSVARNEASYIPGLPLKIVFIGRCTDIKGVHILIEAVKMIPKANVEVYFFGPYWDDTAYGKVQIDAIKNDHRFKVPQLIPPNDVVSELKNMDVCVIPSLWPETGPFTVFDAFAASLPVLGTNYAGIAERVTDGINGLLFEWGNSQDLAAKIERLLDDPTLLPLLKKGIVRNRTFQEMALDFLKLYASLDQLKNESSN